MGAKDCSTGYFIESSNVRFRKTNNIFTWVNPGRLLQQASHLLKSLDKKQSWVFMFKYPNHLKKAFLKILSPSLSIGAWKFWSLTCGLPK